MDVVFLVVAIFVVAVPFGIFMAKRFPHPYFTRRRAEIDEAMKQ